MIRSVARRTYQKARSISRRMQETTAIKNRQAADEELCLSLKAKPKLRVLFYLIHSSVWKYHHLYWLFEASPHFEPVVIICPYTSYGKDIEMEETEASVRLCKSNNYRHEKPDLDGESGFSIHSLEGDIVFYTNPHRLTDESFFIENARNSLACYAPYSFHITSLHQLQYNQLFHNLLWRAYYETEMHQEFARNHARNNAVNVRVSCYPGNDFFIDATYAPKDVWKTQRAKKKRIIWAPHHTIGPNESGLGYSTFLQNADFITELCTELGDKIQMAFKPHPLLKAKLFREPTWGRSRTDAFYQGWKNRENTQLEESEYTDLFLTSDAMILDSASFMTEYMSLNKPSCFLLRDESVTSKFNSFGKMVYDHLYNAEDNRQLRDFIEKNVIEENDPVAETRKAFRDQHLLPKDGKLASEIIFNDISSTLNKHES